MIRQLGKKIALAVALAGATGAAFAQDAAATSVSQNSVLSTCSDVAAACVSDATLYIGSLAPNVPSQTLADFVVAMVDVALQDPICNQVDFQIADALEAVAGYAPDPAQQQQIVAIAETLRRCENVVTAAIPLSSSPG